MAAWIGREILPHERDLRRWLGRMLRAADDVEDIVQECYCVFATLDAVDHLLEPRAYLFTMARNLALKQLRRSRVVRIEAMAEMDTSAWASDAPDPEQIVAWRQEWARVQAAMAALPERCRAIVQMRRIDGLSQKEIARRLGVSETIVENEASRGLRAVLRRLVGTDAAADGRKAGHRRDRGRSARRA